jgi:hypothetical protein
LPGERLKPLRIFLPSVSFHIRELNGEAPVGQTFWLPDGAANAATERLPAIGAGVSLWLRISAKKDYLSNHPAPMPLAPEVQQLIQQVEQLSGRPVHVMEDADLRLRATVTPARNGAPAHFVRFRPGSPSLDYLLASQLQFLVRTFTCPPAERWDIVSTDAERDAGIKAMGLGEFEEPFARMMIGSIITQLRTYSIGFRVDDWIWKNLPGLREQQEDEIRSQLAENERALKPETRQKFPKPLVDANTSMNALYATLWGERFHETRLVIPFVAMGYQGKAAELRAALDELPDEPLNDRILIERWALVVGLSGSFHFKPYTTD